LISSTSHHPFGSLDANAKHNMTQLLDGSRQYARWGRQRTLIHRADSTSICYEDVQTTELGYGGSDNLLSPRHIPHVSREDKDLGRGALAEDGVSARVQGCLSASHESNLCAGAGVLERDLGADAARCTGDQHHLPRECLRFIMHLGIDGRIDTGDR
jgi:hypothetical protein